MKMERMIAILAVACAITMLAACNAPDTKAPDAQQTQTQATETQAVASCDRQCLLDLMTRYLGALVTHDPKAMPFADNAKFVESTAQIPLGEGLWITASGGPGPFQIYAADPVAQQVACLKGGKIYDIEAIGFTLPYGQRSGWE